MQPWQKVVTPRQEVHEGRSFSPDEFAVALGQVMREADSSQRRRHLQVERRLAVLTTEV